MPLIPLVIAFGLGAAGGGYLMSSTGNLVKVAALGAGAYLVYQKVS